MALALNTALDIAALEAAPALQTALALEAALRRSLLETLADVQGRRSEIISVLTIRSRLFA